MRMKTIRISGDMIDAKKLRRAIENGLTGAAKATKVDFDVTTQSWSKRPTFTIESEPGKRTVATENEVYGYVDEGTKPHLITAKSPNKPLTFGVGGSPKTTPRVIGSYSGRKGTTIVRAQVVHHPGSAARDFSETIKEKWDRELVNILQRAVDSAV